MLLNTILDKEKLSLKELVVYELIEEAQRRGEKITQYQISREERWLGSNSKHEPITRESTLRQIRKIIRDLRIKHRAQIISDSNGYWIPRTQREVEVYMEKLEMSAKKSARAFLTTYHAMKKTFGVYSNYFNTMELDLQFEKK